MDQTVEGLVKGLGDFAPADSSITIISPEKPDDIPEECGTCQCQHLEGSVASRQVLLEVSSALSHLFSRQSNGASCSNTDTCSSLLLGCKVLMAALQFHRTQVA